MVTRRSASPSHSCKAHHPSRFGAEPFAPFARAARTACVCSWVSVTLRLSTRVSFSGWSLTAVVVTIRPVGPSRSMRSGLMPSEVFSTVSYLILPSERTHEVGGEVAAHPGGLVDHEEPVRERLLSVGEGTFAHSRQGVIRAVREEGEHALGQVALAAGTRPLHRHAHRTVKES